MAKRNEVLNVLDLLTEQHAHVDALIGVLENGKGDRVAAFAELADSLAAHAEVEEKIFYPRVMSAQTSELLHESVQEHLAMKRVLADLLAAKLDDDDFDAKLSVLKETVSHHAHEEEEQKLFPILRKLLTEDDLAALGNEVLALFETLMKSSPRNQVPRQTREAARLPSA
ncbi:MAG TPA: hemerythrin domain-containing protein [Kofleriaceae bacterium]|jgi:hemerythrin superfamily protein